MAETVTTQVLIPRTELGTTEALMAFLTTMTQEQQKDLLSFLRGVAFGQNLAVK